MADAGIIDISPPLRAFLPCRPGDARFSTEPVRRIVPDRPVAVSRFTCSTHAGTHADAASHDDPDGAAIDPLPGRADAP